MSIKVNWLAMEDKLRETLRSWKRMPQSSREERVINAEQTLKIIDNIICDFTKRGCEL